MFRRLEGSLLPDIVVPQTLEGLGYKINDENKICSIANPEEGWVYKVSSNVRYNEKRGTTMNNILRAEIAKGMAKLDTEQLYLPQLTTVQPKNEQFLPIYSTPLQELKKKSRIIVVVPQESVSFGMLSLSDIFGGEGLEAGSTISLVKQLSARGENSPGLLVLNPNEVYFSHEFKRTLTNRAWQDRPRDSIAHPPHYIDNKWNRIPGNETTENHIQFVLDKILLNEQYVAADAKIDFIGLMVGGDKLLQHLNANWPLYEQKVSTISLVHVWQSKTVISDPSFAEFFRERARMWVVSPAPPNTPVACPSNSKMEIHEQHVMCPVFSGGDVERDENVFPRIMGSMLDWMEEVSKDEDYANPEYVIEDIDWSAQDEKVDEAEEEGDNGGVKITSEGEGEHETAVGVEMVDEMMEAKAED